MGVDEWGCGSFGTRCCPGLDCFFHSGQGASGSCVESSGPPTVNASSAKEDCSTGPCDDAPCCDGLVCGAEGAPGWCVEPSGPPTVSVSIQTILAYCCPGVSCKEVGVQSVLNVWELHA